MSAPDDIVFRAAAFAARAHDHHLRKDGRTPYVSHPFRVCLVVRHVFGFTDPEMLAAALLHDTIEDTRTDYDDLLAEFGKNVADWVALLSKDKRLEDRPGDGGRETQFVKRLGEAPWQVKVIKLADIYDNAWDFENFPPELRTGKKRADTVEKSRRYLEAVRVGPPEQVVQAVEERLKELKAG